MCHRHQSKKEVIAAMLKTAEYVDAIDTITIKIIEEAQC
ncbi:hypothetical protein GPLA_0370 [Paraglaciecola polaris LMG 21857]|uniref:Uncharacterized protein n=1 Tax=Paraglaciecola polaris LMG 21857 TaxID=1129793 RepID=K6YEZ8_9ALTE|nr:hypothetical protein GPLA_0370 [Paraglaciecola polaris LMG 21857]